VSTADHTQDTSLRNTSMYFYLLKFDDVLLLVFKTPIIFVAACLNFQLNWCVLTPKDFFS